MRRLRISARNPYHKIPLDKRVRMERSLRIWRLTAKRGAHWAIIKARGRIQGQAKQLELQHQFAISTAEHAAAELGNMKGVVMKAGQLIGFIAEGLPPQAQAALATLQSDAPPMAPELAVRVVETEFGRPISKLFLEWSEMPVAAASIGQVHKAVTRDGRVVAVKVQYPGVDVAVGADLENAEAMYAMMSAFSFKGLDVKGLVRELTLRISDELDYRIEAANQTEFATRYAGHPFVRIPTVLPHLSSQRVMTSDWVDGMNWQTFVDSASEPTRQHAAEVMFRFVQGAVQRYGVFNGDPHPGNYRFHHDGTITFLDFGLVKKWQPGEFDGLSPVLDATLASDPAATVAALVSAGFLSVTHGLDPQRVWEYVSGPYEPYLTPEFTFSRPWVGSMLEKLIAVNGPYSDVIAKINMPPSFVLLDRVVWGTAAILGKLSAHGPWRGILDEYRKGTAPVTELGRIEQTWFTNKP